MLFSDAYILFILCFGWHKTENKQNCQKLKYEICFENLGYDEESWSYDKAF